MRFIRSRFFRSAIIIISFFILVSLPRSIADLWQKQGILSQKQQQLAVVKAENDQLKIKFTEVQSDTFIEREARDKLGMVRPGETIVLLPGTNSADTGGDLPKTPNLPNWQKWWKLFF